MDGGCGAAAVGLTGCLRLKAVLAFLVVFGWKIGPCLCDLCPPFLGLGKRLMKVRVCDGRFKVLMNLGWLWVMMKVCGVVLVIKR